MKSNLISTIGIIIFSFIGSALAAPPQLTLVKEVVGGEATVFDWDLTADGTRANDLSGAGFISGFVDPDTFLLSESAGQPGYTAGDWDCTGGGILDGQSLTLSVDEVVTCTIINTYVPPVVVFNTDFALPSLPIGDGTGTPVCVDEISGLVTAGCDVSDHIDPTLVQKRVRDVCAAGFLIRVINSDGSVVCEPDTDTHLSEGEVDDFVANNGYSTGPHTVYVADFGLILQDSSFSVDPNTMQRRVTGTCPAKQFMVGINEDGTIQCSALPVDCSIELVCPTPTVGKSCVAGRLSDALTGVPLEANILPGENCGNGALGGACDLTLEVHDALSFATNPGSSVPLAHDGLLVDGCGRFLFNDVTPPGLGFIAVTVNDVGSINELSAHFAPLAANETIEQLNALSVRISTVQLWTTSAGSPFGATTFAERGVVLGTFKKDGTPVSGTTITTDGSVRPSDDFYFSDADSNTRSTINVAQTATGNNGSALIVDSELVNHSGVGGESEGCAWSEGLVDAIPGVVSVSEFHCN